MTFIEYTIIKYEYETGCKNLIYYMIAWTSW